MPMTEELKEYLASKKRDFTTAAIYTEHLVAVGKLGVDCLMTFLLLNKWRKFTSHPNFKGRKDGWLDVSDATRSRWDIGDQAWFESLVELQNAGLVKLGKEDDGNIVVSMLTDFPVKPTYS